MLFRSKLEGGFSDKALVMPLLLTESFIPFAEPVLLLHEKHIKARHDVLIKVAV